MDAEEAHKQDAAARVLADIELPADLKRVLPSETLPSAPDAADRWTVMYFSSAVLNAYDRHAGNRVRVLILAISLVLFALFVGLPAKPDGGASAIAMVCALGFAFCVATAARDGTTRSLGRWLMPFESSELARTVLTQEHMAWLHQNLTRQLVDVLVSQGPLSYGFMLILNAEGSAGVIGRFAEVFGGDAVREFARLHPPMNLPRRARND